MIYYIRMAISTAILTPLSLRKADNYTSNTDTRSSAQRYDRTRRLYRLLSVKREKEKRQHIYNIWGALFLRVSSEQRRMIRVMTALTFEVRSERPAAVINSTAWQHYKAKVHHKIGPTLSFCVRTSDRRINAVKIDKTTRRMIYAD